MLSYGATKIQLGLFVVFQAWSLTVCVSLYGVRSRQLKKTIPLPVVFDELNPDEIVEAGPLADGLAGMDKAEKKEEHIKDAVRNYSATTQAFQDIPVPGEKWND
jgi:hypothetical protein